MITTIDGDREEEVGVNADNEAHWCWILSEMIKVCSSCAVVMSGESDPLFSVSSDKRIDQKVCLVPANARPSTPFV